MKTLFNIFCTAIIAVGFTACSFLDIVPDEKEKAEDAFEDVMAAERYLYSCYTYLPNPRAGANSLDFMTGDEVITAFEHETFAAFPKGNYTASTPVISYWNTLFQGLRQCYIFLNNVDKVPNLPSATLADYKAQATFLIGYYHFLLSRCYGPVIIIDEEPSILTLPEDYKPRTSYDDCVDFICQKFDEAAAGLPASRPILYYGLATSVAAKAMKAKMLLMAASPLFNGNSEFYANFKDKDGNLLMPQQYDAQKWVKAKDAYREAITLAEQNGYALYTTNEFNNGNAEPADSIQHCLRYNIMEPGNKEIIWADAREEGYYGLQNKSTPFSSSSAWNGVSPTLAMVERFYTKNGLPIREDPTYSQDFYKVVTVGDEQSNQAKPGGQTVSLNLDREPRFYSWIAFQGGYYEILSSASNGAYTEDPNYLTTTGGAKLVCSFLNGGNCARGSRTNNYAPSGYLNKKGVDPGYAISKSLKSPINYPWPIIRLAELYLGYAEACVETNELDNAKEYLNRVRKRAGIPSVEQSWETIAGKTLDQSRLRDIVRRERQIEFYLENQNFWDMRRWKIADQYFNVKAKGFDIDASDISDFAQVKVIDFERKFETPTNYLLPIPLDDVNKNLHLVQNPGY
ncbi:MAG: RagB/SusD family nutrient uptake outer membrane protein [Bacteroidales bacterium]|nr:RagB/SusD family nutrient uptake outer membrane protein [Bacteroidales bacterium]